MNKALTTSESLIASLCREIEHIRYRYTMIINSLDSCKDKLLKERLKLEINKLSIRKDEIKKITNTLSNKEDLSILFLIELTERPLNLSA